MRPAKTDHICGICQNGDGNITYTAKEMMFGLRDEFEYFQCDNCGCLQISELPQDISKYYPKEYVSFNFEGDIKRGLKARVKRRIYKLSLLRRNSLEKLISVLFQPTMYKVYNSVKLDLDSRILDVGCGNGKNFLFPLANYGFKNILGCDPFIDDEIAYPNGLTIQKRDVLDVDGQWDLITYHHAFEHIANPIENLKQVRSILATEGICIIRIPTVSSYAWEHYKTDWFQLDAPRHYFLHSVDSMKHMAQLSGLEMYRIEYDSTYFQFMESERRIRGLAIREEDPPNGTGWLKMKFRKKVFKRRARKLNKEKRGDQAAFYFRKRIE